MTPEPPLSATRWTVTRLTAADPSFGPAEAHHAVVARLSALT
ncbi:hypothetical protein ACGF13_22530 [Kitasatospora sp. NPDC048286]